MKKTSFRVTKATLELENALIQKMDIPRTTFHRRMIDYYLEYDRTVKPQLLIRKMTDPNYIQKDEMEQIYLDEKREQLLLEVAEEQARVHQKVWNKYSAFSGIIDILCSDGSGGIGIGDLIRQRE